MLQSKLHRRDFVANVLPRVKFDMMENSVFLFATLSIEMYRDRAFELAPAKPDRV